MQLSRFFLRQIVALAICWFVLAMPLLGATVPSLILTNAAQVRSLAPESVGKAYTAELTAVVTFSDLTRGLLYAQDSTGGVFISPKTRVWDWRVGHKIRISGVVSQGSHLPYIASAMVEDLGLGKMPVPRQASYRQLGTDSEDGNWIEVRGVVRNAEIINGQLQILVAGEGERVNAIFANSLAFSQTPADLLDAEVSVQGVCGAVESKLGSPFLVAVHVPSFEYLVVNRSSAKPSILSPPVPLSSLSVTNPASAFTHRVHIKGRLSQAEDGKYYVNDGTGTVLLRPVRPVMVSSNMLVEAFGFPGCRPEGPVLEDAVAFGLGLSCPEGDSGPPQFLPILTRAQDIRELPKAELERGYPVRIEGKISLSDPAPHWGLLYVEDQTAGIYIDDSLGTFTGTTGDSVDVEGFTGAGKYTPIIRNPHFTLLAERFHLPRPKRPTQEQLFSGGMDAQRVEIDGVVRYYIEENGHYSIKIYSGGNLIWAYLPVAGVEGSLTNLIDADVTVMGVCGTKVNDQGQATGVWLGIPLQHHISVIKPAPEDPFLLPVRKVNRLLQFQPQNDLRHRVHVCGTVTFRDPAWHTVFIQDDSGGIFVRALTKPDMDVGDAADVIGFVDADSHGPSIGEALLRRIGPGTLPEPVVVTAEKAVSGKFDSRLITLKARYLEPLRDSNGRGLVCQADNWVFIAFLEGSQPALPSLRPGSILKLTGVCSVEQAATLVSQMRLWLRSPNDVVVLQKASWTSGELSTVLGIMALILAATAAWVVLLRQSIRRKTSELARSETQLTTIYENTPIMMCLVNEQHEVENMNRAMIDFLHDFSGETDRARFGNLMGCLGSEQEPYMCGSGVQCKTCPVRLAITTTFKTGQSCRQMERLMSFLRNGERQDIWVSASTALMHFDHVSKVLVCVEDISERKHLEAQFLQAQKMEAIGQLAGGIAHDFNNILTAAIMNINFLRRNPGLDRDTVDGLAELEKDTFRAADLTRQLLLFSRRQAMAPRRLDMNDVISGLMKLLKRLLGEHIEMRTIYSPDAMWINADRGMLEQMMTNLCVNARDAMPKGGRLTLKVESVRIEREDVRPESEMRPGVFVCVVVEDSGIGMDAETMKHIFEPFFTTKEVGKGTGLGLATVYGIIKQHQGWVDVQSVPGQGTIFRVHLPAAEELNTSPETESVIPVIGGTETILFVEDDASLRRVVSQSLAQRGYTVFEARTAADAMKIWEQHNGRIQLLLTDVVMPGGMSGLDLALRLRQLNPHLKIIVSSGYSIDLTEAGGAKSGIRTLPKPYEASTLILAVRECLDGAESSSHIN